MLHLNPVNSSWRRMQVPTPEQRLRILKAIKTTAVRRPEHEWFLWNNREYIEKKQRYNSQKKKEKWAWGIMSVAAATATTESTIQHSEMVQRRNHMINAEEL